MRGFAIAVLAAGLASCASPPGLYETDDADAVPIYRGLIGRFPELPDIIGSASNRDPVDPGRLAEAVASYDALLAELVRAARARGCEWTHAKPPGITEPFPIDYGITATRALIVRGRMRVEKGDVDGGVEDLLVAARFGSDLLQDQWMIGKLMGCIGIALSADELQRQLAGTALLPRHASLIERSLSSLDRRFPPFERWIRDERRMALSLVDSLRDSGFQETLNAIHRTAGAEPSKDGGGLVIAAWDAWFRSVLKNDPHGTRARIALRWRERLAPLEQEVQKPVNARSTTPLVEALKGDTSVLSQRMMVHMLRGSSVDDAALNDIADFLLLFWRPRADKIGKNSANIQVLLRFTQLAARLEGQRFRTGAYPDSLTETGEVPPDPYTGGPLQYRRIVQSDGEGYVLSSAGPREDAEVRIRVLVDECRFDRDLFERKNVQAQRGDADAHTWGVFRKRDPLR